MKILAIETSCDETAAAVIENCNGDIKILSSVIASQIDLHKKFGGVYPEIASRAHTESILAVVQEALQNSKSQILNPKQILNNKSQKFKTLEFENLNIVSNLEFNASNLLSDIDVIAVTSGPGLIGSLLVGVNAAKTLAFANNLPIIGINHWLGHIYSNFADKTPEFPALILIVSGGHTGLVLMKSHTEIETLGETLDDAAGEAFDKVAKLLGLGYPGGPAISRMAQTGEPFKYQFPRSMLDRDDFNFSFSGLKTAVLYESKKHKLDNKTKADFAASFQQTVIDILIGKTLRAAQKYQPKSILLCGGVSANKELREQMSHKVTQSLGDSVTFHVPPLSLTTDNAAMIGIAAAYQIKAGVKPTTHEHINANANLEL